MAGSFDFSGGGTPQLTDFAAPIGVFRYQDSAPNGSRYTWLPNVRCEQVQSKEGAEPSTAQFSYILQDDISPDQYPSQFEQVWPINSPFSDYKVKSGDRLAVLWGDPQGNLHVLWDGFAQVPQTDLASGSQHVTFVGVDVAIRLWDDVIGGRQQREGTQPRIPLFVVPTDINTRFNPDGKGNCTPSSPFDSYDEIDPDTGGAYPVFLDSNIKDSVTLEKIASSWTVGGAVRYLLEFYNSKKYVDNPDFSVLDKLLENRQPIGDTIYDPTDPSTYTENPVIIRDLDVTNRPMPEVLESMLGYAGFRFRFVCEGNPAPGGGPEEPYHYIEVYRFDADGPTDPKSVWLPMTRSGLDVNQCNLGGFQAVNDFHSLANSFNIETEPIRYEASFVLAPGFTPVVGDELAINKKKFLRSNVDDTSSGLKDKYRLYIVDELGEGHWDSEGESFVTEVDFDFSDLFLAEDVGSPKPLEINWVGRYRPGIRTLFTKDGLGKPKTAKLELSRDYTSTTPPCLWNGTGTWQNIGDGWELLKDQLGILVTADDPDEWPIGTPRMPVGELLQETTPKLRGIKSIANPGTAQGDKHFHLKLTCVISSDHCLYAGAPKRPASPYPFAVNRRTDAKDHFKKHIIAPFSTYNNGHLPVLATDDTQAAKTYSSQLRTAHEFPPLAGSVTIPWLSIGYNISDRIAAINGRNVSMQVNSAVESGEKPSYPFIVGVTWDFRGNHQSTVLQLSDRRTEPQPVQGHMHQGKRR